MAVMVIGPPDIFFLFLTLCVVLGVVSCDISCNVQVAYTTPELFFLIGSMQLRGDPGLWGETLVFGKFFLFLTWS